MKVQVIKSYGIIPAGTVMDVVKVLAKENMYICTWSSYMGTYLRSIDRDCCEVI